MPTNFSTDAQLRVNDPVITSVIQGYSNSEGIASFVAPVVPVPTRAGKVIRFGKENFAVMDLRRSPGGNVKRLGSSFETDTYYIRQHAIGSEVAREVYEEAMNGDAKLDLRAQAAIRTAAALQQSWEADVIDQLWDTTKYETANVIAAGGVVADYDNLIADAQELIRKQIGRYANSAVIGSGTSLAVRRNSVYRDRVKYTSSASINLDMIAAWWGLSRGVKAATRQRLDLTTGLLTDMVPAGSILLFYNPEGATVDGFLPSDQADRAEAALAYTYTLEGYPIAEEERFDADRKVFVTDLIAEQSVQVVGMGETGKVGAGVLITGITV
jgi:hypothetical protein